MTARTYAALVGGIFLALGIAGFAPMLWEKAAPSPRLSVKVFYASILGIFTVNLILSMVHLVIGLWGVMAANNRYSALAFTRAGTVLLLLMGILGLIPVRVVQTVYGLVPLHGNNAWLYLICGAIGIFFSFRPGYVLTQVGVRGEMNPHLPNK
jgi:hypothetical protein